MLVSSAFASFRSSPAAVAAAIVATLGFASSVGAATVIQADLEPIFDVDVVINGVIGDFDTEMDSIEGEWSFLTDAAGFETCSPNLPNDGTFQETWWRPFVQLGFAQDDDGLNAWQSAYPSDTSATVQVPNLHYEMLHLFATGAWFTQIKVSLNYTTGDPDVSSPIAFPSWFDSKPKPLFELIRFLDRGKLVEGTLSCEDANNPGIQGLALRVDPARVLTSFTLTREEESLDGRLSVFGATLVRAQQVTNFNFTPVFNADVIVNSSEDCLEEDIDPTQSLVDSSGYLMTDSAHTCIGGGDEIPGLPDDGFVGGNGAHPGFDLQLSDADLGNNARYSLGEDDFTVDVADGQYDEVHLFGTSGNGQVTYTFTLKYATGDDDVFPGEIMPELYVFIPDESSAGQAPEGSNNHYILVGEMDLTSSCETDCWENHDLNDARIYGRAFQADPARTLTAIRVQRSASLTEGEDPAVLAIFGASGVVRNDSYLFVDDFESGGATSWSSSAGIAP